MDYINYYKQMRVILIYDLPVVEEQDRRIYTRFHKNLIALGFYMLQFSVYTKVIQNDSSFKQLSNKLNKIIPNKGSIIILKITEKQYQDMVYLTGEKNKYDLLVGGRELVVFGESE